jgi:hypothetical protein
MLWAIRLDWPAGDHEFVCARDSERSVQRELTGLRTYWRRAPMRPTATVVRISAHDFALHATARPDCRAPDCPR